MTIARRSVGDQPKRWVTFWRRTPAFFDQVRVLNEIDFESGDSSRALVGFSVRYRSFAGICHRQMPEDELNFDLIKIGTRWSIEKIWSPIC